MGLGDLFKGASDMLNKAKEAIEETTGMDLDAMKDQIADKVGDMKEAVSNPEELLEKAKDKFAEVKDAAEHKFAEAKDAIGDKIEDLTGGGHDDSKPA